MSVSLRNYTRGATQVALRSEVTGSTRYYHFDHQGTTQVLTDGTGAVTDRFASDAWGVEVKRTGLSANPRWYAGDRGYYFQDDEELYYAADSYYLPTNARWITPITYSGSDVASYLLASNRPALTHTTALDALFVESDLLSATGVLPQALELLARKPKQPEPPGSIFVDSNRKLKCPNEHEEKTCKSEHPNCPPKPPAGYVAGNYDLLKQILRQHRGRPIRSNVTPGNDDCPPNYSAPECVGFHETFYFRLGVKSILCCKWCVDATLFGPTIVTGCRFGKTHGPPFGTGT